MTTFSDFARKPASADAPQAEAAMPAVTHPAPVLAGHSFAALGPNPPVQRSEKETDLNAFPSDISPADLSPEEEGPMAEEDELQRKAVQRRGGGEDLSQIPDVPVATGGGSALPVPVQAKMEAAFGQSFGDVRIHQGNEAASVGALAYTRGTDIHFQPGLYDPHTSSGQELLGHELTHVVQQREGRVASPDHGEGAAPINDDHALESEADEMGARAASMDIHADEFDPAAA